MPKDLHTLKGESRLALSLQYFSFVHIDLVFIAVVLVLLATPWLLYPLGIVRLFSTRMVSKGETSTSLPRVSVLIPVHNEELHIREKILNILEMTPPSGGIQIVVGVDGAQDATSQILSTFGDRITVVHGARRQGKASMLNRLVEVADSDLLLITDAASRFKPGLLLQLARGMTDGVGCVAAAYGVRTTRSGLGRLLGEYWRSMCQLRRVESDRGMLLAGHGAGYLLRKSLYRPLPADTINDDFVIPLEAHRRGYAVRYLHNACATDVRKERTNKTFSRAARIAQGNLQMFVRHSDLLHPRYGRVAVAFWLGKVVKTLCPLLIVPLYLMIVMKAGDSYLMLALGALISLGFGAGVVELWLGAAGRSVRWSPFSLASTVVLVVAAHCVGVGRFMLRLNGARWSRGRESRPIVTDEQASIPPRVHYIKRVLDLLGAFALIAVVWPIAAMSAVFVRLSSPGPIIYSQERVSSHHVEGKSLFRMYKFRTMRVDAEQATGPVWAQDHDPRVTRVGRVLRKLRIDELPQLLNVLLGEMSLVGPRPERPHFTDRLEDEIPRYADRLASAKPGITGWAQVNCEYDVSVDSVRRKLLYDFTYVAHMYSIASYLKMEARVVFATVRVVALGKGAR